MRALRIILRQSSANYRKEETLENKMTYPLPPLSTVIGALHQACGYKSYHPMDISIQGSYKSMHREPYTDYCFLNSIMDDRGMLVKFNAKDSLSGAFIKVAKAQKPQGNSFMKGITINVFRQDLMDEYRNIRNNSREIDEEKKKLKDEKKIISDEKKKLTKGSDEYENLLEKENLLKKKEASLKERETSLVKEPLSYYKSLTTSLKYYELLNDIKLILHVSADESTLNDLKDNIFNLTAIGRSEDFVDVQSAEFVELNENLKLEKEVVSDFSAYIPIELIRNDMVFTKFSGVRTECGTKYMINKDYKIEGNKRVFNKKKLMYVSEHSINKINPEKGVYFDGKYIISFV